MEKIRIFELIYFFVTAFLIYKLGWTFPLGFVMGMVIMSTTLLFPSPKMEIFMDNLFGYSKNKTIVMKNESEKLNKQTEKYSVKYKN